MEFDKDTLIETYRSWVLDSAALRAYSLPEGAIGILCQVPGIAAGKQWRGYHMEQVGIVCEGPRRNPDPWMEWVVRLGDTPHFLEVWRRRVYHEGNPHLSAVARWSPDLVYTRIGFEGFEHSHTDAEKQAAVRGDALLKFTNRLGRLPAIKDPVTQELLARAEAMKVDEPCLKWPEIAKRLNISPRQLRDWRRAKRGSA